MSLRLCGENLCEPLCLSVSVVKKPIKTLCESLCPCVSVVKTPSKTRQALDYGQGIKGNPHHPFE